MPTVQISANEALILSVTVAEGVAQLCSNIATPAETESVDLEEANGRYLAEAFLTPFPMPPFRRSMMDGYAIRSEWTEAATPNNPLLIKTAGESRAGMIVMDDADAEPRALRVFTGAPVPDFYDTVIVQEMVAIRSASKSGKRIAIDRRVPAGNHIAEAGEDVPQHTSLLHPGTKLGAREMAILASYGKPSVVVYKKPIAVVLPIGDELQPQGTSLLPNHIYDSNGVTAAMFATQLGVKAIRRKPVQDELEAIALELDAAFEQADIVITTGGVSVGDYDYAERAAVKSGWEPVFTKVLMRPGTPTSAFRRGSKLLLCLSGNPSACYAALELLAKPVLRKLTGSASYESVWMAGVLDGSIRKPCPYPRYLRAVAQFTDGQWKISPLPNDRSGNIAAFSVANALAVIPAGGKGASAGEIASFTLLT
ncbi:molybdopterin molybdotransferase MoeA [Paenibacillus sp. NEAU-GSW1]|uniref:molybdopterin molybdotransferase MoeA n=1 Tax=Paenibacillus sp. NEAU-GSW1 TaxID=2682486 RepID=UPI00156368AC|nr:molybdopterin molybdotransferase MoeA [Paenibacillus sp. NEAU-GSW1]